MIDTKKQADNAFGKGLVMDQNPINADNNTLSNCLNGTMITYNGNEMMLQNDMGNGRIETAYLPPGYVPIGIKEHGGIIYVASYNPLTNHGQLGSFPSPERNISSDEMGNSPNLVINSGTFGFNNLRGVNTLYSKIAVLDDSILRPGDKFALAFKDSSGLSLSDYITNYNNSEQSKILKLSVAVRDSNGNLQDITEDLKKFENGYFMRENASLSQSTTLDELRQETDNSYYNIYSGKLSGELYLVAELATINDYELQVTGNEVEGKRSLTFTGTFKAELPEIFKGASVSIKESTATAEMSGFVPIENPNDKTHTIKVSDINPEAKIYYQITPVLNYAKLDSMTKSGVLDMSLFGTGNIELNEWRYFNDFTNNKLYLNWGMSTYLRNDEISKEVINSISFNFFKFENNEFYNEFEITTKSRRNYNGNFIETISYDQVSPGQIYVVQIKVDLTYNQSPREVYFYKLLYTSEYFNEFYSDGVTQDFTTIPINLKVYSNTSLQEVKKNVNIGKITQSPTYTMINAPTFEKYGDYQFYYIQDQKTSAEYKVNVENSLTYDSFDNENESWDFPFKLNKEYLSSETTMQSSEAKVSDVINVGNFIDDIQNDTVISESEALQEHIVGYTDSLENGVLKVDINTVSKYVAEQSVQNISAASGSGFRPYMHESNFYSIFGYKRDETMTQPQYGLNMKVGRKDRKGRLWFDVCEYTGSSYSESAKGTCLNKDNLATNRTDREWKTQIVPALIDGLNTSLTNVPNIFFMIGGDTDKWSADKYGNGNLKSRSDSSYTVDYNIVLWKGYNEDNMYYMLNQYFTKAGASSNGLARLHDIFTNIYTKQDFVYSGNMYKSGNYAYTQDYKVNYESNLVTNYNKKENTSPVAISDEVAFSMNDALDYLYAQLADAYMTEDQLNDLKASKNLEISVEIPDSVEYKVELQADNAEIDDVVLRYINVTGTMAEGALESSQGDIITSDYAGNPFSDNEMYYVGGDGKAYPLSVATGLSGSVLESKGVSYITLNNMYKGFKVQYDQVTKMYQIRVNPGGVTAFTTSLNGDLPRISSDDRPFNPANSAEGQGCLLDIKLTDDAKLLR